MASNGPDVAERADIHKSCKSIETLLNLLNEYCEAAGLVVILQRRLAKALRETAGLKVTKGVAANAMNTSATIFEALSEIDAKFAKIADKEYDSISAEVKKWFKKLAKEEKTHDEKMATANAKIKQAGQAYEKKSKKKATDATEEHTRYINLISTLGPELSQEKYNHALNVTQRHMSATFSVAGCLSRLADTEWLKACEGVRRFSPTVGPLGHWRALCEGGWTGPIPPPLPDLDEAQPQQIEPEPINVRQVEEEQRLTIPTSNPETRASRESMEQIRNEYRPLVHTPETDTPQRDHLSPPRGALAIQPPSASTSLYGAVDTSQPPIAPADTLRPSYADTNTDSVRSLSAFPSPPTHFPLPLPRQQQLSNLSHSVDSSSSNVNFPSMMSESPISANEDSTSHLEVEQPSAGPSSQLNRSTESPPPSVTSSPEQRFRERPVDAPSGKIRPSSSQENGLKRPLPAQAEEFLQTETAYQQEVERVSPPVPRQRSPPAGNISPSRDDYLHEGREFGVEKNLVRSDKARTVESPKRMERTDTGGTGGSIVAEMRNLYSSNPGSTSPPRGLPRLPLSVSDLAARYQSGDVPLSPRARAGSIPVSRQLSLPPPETTYQSQESSYQERFTPGYHTGLSGSGSPTPEDRRRQRLDDLANLELAEKERELRQREYDIEMRARELERDRARLLSIRAGGDDGDRNQSGSQSGHNSQAALRPRERRTSLRYQLQRPSSSKGLDPVNESVRPQFQLFPRGADPISSLSSPNGQNSPQPSSPTQVETPHKYQSHEQRHNPRGSTSTMDSSTTASTSQHAPYCGCSTCSIAKYKTSTPSGPATNSPKLNEKPSTNTLHPPPPEKPRGSWMRRLSMPVSVGNAFNLDSKRNTSSNYGLGSGISSSGGGGRGLFSQKNTSATRLRSPDGELDRVEEDGRLSRGGVGAGGRRSYDVNGINNRSMTNLGMTGRR